MTMLLEEFINNKIPKHLVLGVNGQDGSYLAETLLARGANVVGVGKQPNSVWVKPHPNYSYQKLNLEDIQEYITYLELARPDYLYHLAAIHGPAGFDYKAKWIEAHTVNTLTVQASLEHFRNGNPHGKFIYASSSKVFDLNANKVISELTKRESNCIYTITKNSATELIHLYRKNYNINSSIFWLFNHESVRRKDSYFIPKVVNTLKKSLEDSKHIAELGDLDFWCDWGDASEYMEIICDVAENNLDEDFILGTGQVINAAHYVGKLFSFYGVNPAQTIKDWKEFKHGEFSPPWKLDLSKLQHVAGRTPKKDIYEISSQMLRTNMLKKI